MEEWRRVVAVICLGKPWQFKRWPKEVFAGVDKGDLVDLFSKVLGVFLHYNDDRWVGGVQRAVEGAGGRGQGLRVYTVSLDDAGGCSCTTATAGGWGAEGRVRGQGSIAGRGAHLGAPYTPSCSPCLPDPLLPSGSPPAFWDRPV